MIKDILFKFVSLIFPPIAMDMYTQRQQEDLMFWIYEGMKND